MKKIIGIVLSLAAVATLSSFVIAHNVNNDKTNNPETISANDVEWKYVKEVKAIRDDGGTFTLYIWAEYKYGRKTEAHACTRLHGTVPTKENIFYNPYRGKEGDFRAKYFCVGYPDGMDRMGYYFD